MPPASGANTKFPRVVIINSSRRRFSNTPRATHNKLTAARAVWPAAGAAKPRDAAAVARGHSQDHWIRSAAASPTSMADPQKAAASRAVWPAAEAAKPLDAAAVTRGRADSPAHSCRSRAGLQVVCAPSAGFQSQRLPRRANGRGERRSPSAFGRSARPRPQTGPPKPAPRSRLR